MVDVANKERQRLERNLHDGAQQRLVALSLELSLLGGELAGDTEAQERLDRARHEIAASLAELREIARGIHPAVVSGHGLGVALEQLAALAPVPVRLAVGDEWAAAGGDRGRGLLPRLRKPHERRQVRPGVVGDGRRQPLERQCAHRGDRRRGRRRRYGTRQRIAGLADRVEALDGRLRIWSPVGGGTRIRAEIPCAP